jgi:hypothetical protein
MSRRSISACSRPTQGRGTHANNLRNSVLPPDAELCRYIIIHVSPSQFFHVLWAGHHGERHVKLMTLGGPGNSVADGRIYMSANSRAFARGNRNAESEDDGNYGSWATRGQPVAGQSETRNRSTNTCLKICLSHATKSDAAPNACVFKLVTLRGIEPTRNDFRNSANERANPQLLA